MMTNDPRMTDNDIDAVDLLDTLRITKNERRRIGGGTWVSGTIGGHRFVARVFPEHAKCPDYELGDSRISKLSLQQIDNPPDRRQL